MNAEKKAYFDELGASGEWTTDNFLKAEIAWQLKRIADRLERISDEDIKIISEWPTE